MVEGEDSDEIQCAYDYNYTGEDARCFPACCWCAKYTPFLFYVTSNEAMASIATLLDPKHNVFCARCLPVLTKNDKSAGIRCYGAECLFNNEEFVSLLRGYEYSNPNYKVYRGMSRLLVTEDTRIKADFRKLKRLPLPHCVKVDKIQQLFTSVHRMPFRKYANVNEVYEQLRQKYEEIRCSYEDVFTIHTLQDNIDLLVDRTPLHERSKVRAPVSSVVGISSITPRGSSCFPRDSFRLRGADTESSSEESTIASMVQISEQSITINSQEVAIPASLPTGSQHMYINEGSLNISSQSIPLNSLEVPISSESFENTNLVPASRPNVASPTSDSSMEVGRSLTRRATVVEHDSQVAGPSGLQQQLRQKQDNKGPHPKRRRLSVATNPSAQEFQQPRSRTVGARLPRLPGG